MTYWLNPLFLDVVPSLCPPTGTDPRVVPPSHRPMVKHFHKRVLWASIASSALLAQARVGA